MCVRLDAKRCGRGQVPAFPHLAPLAVWQRARQQHRTHNRKLILLNKTDGSNGAWLHCPRHHRTKMGTYLVKALQQAHDAALNLLLLQATASAVHADGDEALSANGNGGSDSAGSSGGEHGR